MNRKDVTYVFVLCPLASSCVCLPSSSSCVHRSSSPRVLLLRCVCTLGLVPSSLVLQCRVSVKTVALRTVCGKVKLVSVPRVIKDKKDNRRSRVIKCDLMSVKVRLRKGIKFNTTTNTKNQSRAYSKYKEDYSLQCRTVGENKKRKRN